MGFFKSTSRTNALENQLAAVLPKDPRPWYRTRHLLLLNVTLLVPLMSSAAVGFDGAMMNGLQTLATWRDYFDHPNGSLLGVMNAIYPIGKIVGLVATTWVSDRFGRTRPLFLGLILLGIGAALQGAAQNLAMFMVSRCLLGFATSFIGQPSPILITELAYPTHRAKITALYNTFYYLGAILAAWSTYGSFRLDSSWSWRIPSILQGALPSIQFIFFFALPESPRWLISKGRVEEARKILQRYHAGGEQDSPLVQFEIREIEQNLEIESSFNSRSSWLDLIKTSANRKRTFIAATVGFFAQWNGIGVISYYLTLVLNTVDITSTRDQALINGLLQVFNYLAATFAGALLVDRAGRRPLFLTSTIGMLLSYIAWTILTSFFTETRNKSLGHAVIAFIFIYNFFYDIAWTPMLQAYPVEIFPFLLRGRGVSVSYISTDIGLIIGQFVNPVAMESIGWKYYIVFCCILALLTAIVYFCYPETKGNTLEEIAEVFEGKRSVSGAGAKQIETGQCVEEQIEYSHDHDGR